MSIVEKLPIELWNMILLNCDRENDALKFIRLFAINREFNYIELNYLKKYFCYDYILGISQCNKNLYKIYKNIDKINDFTSYQYYYSIMFNSIFFKYNYYNYDELIGISIYFREHLFNKIKKPKDKKKFLNITNKLIKDVYYNKLNKNIKLMIDLI